MSRSDKSSEVQICDWITPRTSSFRDIGALLVPTRPDHVKPSQEKDGGFVQ